VGLEPQNHQVIGNMAGIWEEVMGIFKEEKKKE
jgi:hypothetical protein